MFDELDKKIIRRLQEDIPLVEEPFKEMAVEIGIEEEFLLKKIQEYKSKGIIRRFGSTLAHRKVGFQANAMVVWEVEEEKIEEIGKQLATFQEVSHCYQRPTAEGWKYNIFTMIHGRTQEECESAVDKISRTVQVSTYQILYSTEELKKNSMKYFVEA